MISNDLDGGIGFAIKVWCGGYNDDSLQAVQQGVVLHASL